MQFIQNVSKEGIAVGRHFDAGENSMLIQILDPAETFPTPKHKFKEVHQFEFLDLEHEAIGTDLEDCICSDEQAAQLVALLKHAQEERMQVVVHCHAGLCRSGAVAEVGVIMGFADTGRFRLPNRLVKGKMLTVLGLDPNTPGRFDAFEEADGTMASSDIIKIVNSEYGG